jgi:hypothetical protein
MKSILVTSLVAIAAAGFAVGSAIAQPGSSANVPVTSLKYGATGVKDASGKELFVAQAYGDLTKGPYGAFLRLPPSFSSIPHSHTGDYWGVVVSGVVVNGKVGSTDVALPVGSYWFQKGGEDHVTKCISPNECVVFLSQQGSFDYVVDKDHKK